MIIIYDYINKIIKLKFEIYIEFEIHVLKINYNFHNFIYNI